MPSVTKGSMRDSMSDTLRLEELQDEEEWYIAQEAECRAEGKDAQADNYFNLAVETRDEINALLANASSVDG